MRLDWYRCYQSKHTSVLFQVPSKKRPPRDNVVAAGIKRLWGRTEHNTHLIPVAPCEGNGTKNIHGAHTRGVQNRSPLLAARHVPHASCGVREFGKMLLRRFCCTRSDGFVDARESTIGVHLGGHRQKYTGASPVSNLDWLKELVVGWPGADFEYKSVAPLADAVESRSLTCQHLERLGGLEVVQPSRTESWPADQTTALSSSFTPTDCPQQALLPRQSGNVTWLHPAFFPFMFLATCRFSRVDQDMVAVTEAAPASSTLLTPPPPLRLHLPFLLGVVRFLGSGRSCSPIRRHRRCWASWRRPPMGKVAAASDVAVRQAVHYFSH